MWIIYNKFLPRRNFFAINLFGVIFVRKDWRKLNPVERNHEYIHTLQQRELLFVGFYLWYVLEWLFRLILHRNATKAYFAIRFEQEAYAHQSELNYVSKRKHYNWLKI